jgi:very-short-patch-repair endonuclease
MKICKYCNIQIDDKHSIYANHVRWCDKNETNGDKGINNVSISKIKYYQNLYPINEYNVSCKICGKDFKLIERESKFNKRNGKYFCSYKCSRKRSEEAKKKISLSTKKLWMNEEYANKVVKNNTNRNRRFTSKGEEEIKKYLKETYIVDGWTSGGGFKYKDVYLTRDMYSNKLEIIVEYDGIWHFKDIHGQLEQKIEKDRLLEEWCIKNNWRLIRIKDDLYRKNSKYWMEQLLISIYNSNEQIIKLY